MLDAEGGKVGNIDIVIVLYDHGGKVINFGGLEVQGVYISGNVRRAFASYVADPRIRAQMDWSNEKNYPRPDFLSSRKRLGPQIASKGGILHGWGKRQAIVIDRAFFDELPALPEVAESEAEVVWLIYDLVRDEASNLNHLALVRQLFTAFAATSAIVNSSPVAPPLETFMRQLQTRLDDELNGKRKSRSPSLGEILEPLEPPADPDQV